jgi:hypothetical protein
MSQEKEIIICECNSTEHQFVFLYETEDEQPMCYIHTHLVKKPFWERVIYAIKYILGYQSKLGAFDEFIINPNDADKLQKVVDYLKTN